jgi:hypothetical protein
MTGRVLMAGCAAALFAACSGGTGGDQAAEEQAAATPAETSMVLVLPPDVQLAVNVERALLAAPASSDSILTANGLTREGLDSLMYAIAGDSAKAAAYSAARR